MTEHDSIINEDKYIKQESKLELKNYNSDRVYIIRPVDSMDMSRLFTEFFDKSFQQFHNALLPKEKIDEFLEMDEIAKKIYTYNSNLLRKAWIKYGHWEWTI